MSCDIGGEDLDSRRRDGYLPRYGVRGASVSVARVSALALGLWLAFSSVACSGACSGNRKPVSSRGAGLSTSTSESDSESASPPHTMDECGEAQLPGIPDCSGDSYYVDVTVGNDANDGSTNAPWASLSHARSAAPGGATICVSSGDYGRFVETTAPNIQERQTIRAAPNATPSLTGVSIKYGSGGNANLTLSGMTVRGTNIRLVEVVGASGVRLNALNVSGETYYGLDGIVVKNAEGTTLDESTVWNVHRGVQIGGSTNTTVFHNFITATAGSGIQYISGNRGGKILYNNIHGADYVRYPDDPNAPRDPHASIISFRSGDIVLRGNHLHGMGGSSGIMFYKPDAAGGEKAYSDVLIENNAFYDTDGTNALRVYGLGTNFVVRNNVMFPGLRADCTDRRYRYNVAINVHSLGPGGTGIRLYNNIFVGIVFVKPQYIEDEANNIAWSWDGWVAKSPSGTSEIITSSYGDCNDVNRIFEDGSFFSRPIDPTFPGRGAYDFSLTADSLARNFGTTGSQPAGSLGVVDANGFVTRGPCRDAHRHSAGPFEVP